MNFASLFLLVKAASEEMASKLEQVDRERDEYRRVYMALLEADRELEAGSTRAEQERFVGAGLPRSRPTLSTLHWRTGRGGSPDGYR